MFVSIYKCILNGVYALSFLDFITHENVDH